MPTVQNIDNISSSDHLKRVHETLAEWFRPDNLELKYAVEKTVEENLFSFEDIKHQILSLKKTATKEHISRWVDQQKLNPGELNSLKVLALHAGNIPLVGFQDLLAIVLTGVRYRGKISRRDPYILPTLIQAFKKNGLLENAVWSTRLSDLKGYLANAVIFSGSISSVDKVFKEIHRFSLLKNNASCLIRTAHYSIAYIEDEEPKTMKNLTEAVFRYGGKGCRSVAVVVSPLRLDTVKCHFTDYIESFWLDNPQHVKPPPSLYHRYAYNTAAGHSQMWLDDFLIEETEMLPESEFVLHWVPGDKHTLKKMMLRDPEGVQSVYSTGRYDELQYEDTDIHPEPLFSAQTPPVDWKPDGTDTIGWLKERI